MWCFYGDQGYVQQCHCAIDDCGCLTNPQIAFAEAAAPAPSPEGFTRDQCALPSGVSVTFLEYLGQKTYSLLDERLHWHPIVFCWNW